jgi:hypothetical protein
MNSKTPSKLPFHEWCMILLFCAILLILAGFALGRQKHLPAPASLEQRETILQVRIEGQVAKPGLYRLPPCTLQKELIEQAQPLPTADLSQVKWRSQLRDGQTIHIPKRHEITIQIIGAVQQPGPMTILSGTRCCELTEQLHVLPEADLHPICKKKRFLQEGDIIEIPFKKQKKKSKTND